MLALGVLLGGCSSSDKLLGSDGSTVLASDPGAGAGGRTASAGAGGAPPKAAAVGEPCVASEEWSPYFVGFGSQDVNIEDRAAQCESTICVVNHFQGRASCRYGQAAGASDCLLPDGSGPVSVEVEPQLVARQATVASICSCRCDGDGPGPYCTCPESMQCEHLVDDLGLGAPELAGSYCTPKGSQYDSAQRSGPVCVAPNCDAADSH